MIQDEGRESYSDAFVLGILIDLLGELCLGANEGVQSSQQNLLSGVGKKCSHDTWLATSLAWFQHASILED